jgi:hypothetical protein
MSSKVYANSLEIAGGATEHKCVAAMPDVCLSPPSPPAGPLPVPYPNTSMSSDLKEGSKDVSIRGSAVSLEDKSHYKSSPLGDEASTKTFGANVIDHSNAGKTHVQAHSSDVKVEKKAVTRTGDIATSNHMSAQPGGGAMTPQLGGVAVGTDGPLEDPKCPCCGKELHANQKDKDGAPLKKSNSADYYAGKRKQIDDKIAGFDDWAKNVSGANPTQVITLKFASAIYGEMTGPRNALAAEEARRGREMLDRLDNLMNDNKDCPNVHDSDDGCGTHFADVPKGAGGEARKEFTNSARAEANQRAAKKLGKPVPKSTTVHHKTPLDAGGCPTSPGNTVSDAELTKPECREIETIQTALQGRTK